MEYSSTKLVVNLVSILKKWIESSQRRHYNLMNQQPISPKKFFTATSTKLSVAPYRQLNIKLAEISLKIKPRQNEIVSELNLQKNNSTFYK